jgi:hypothetical protein
MPRTLAAPEKIENATKTEAAFPSQTVFDANGLLAEYSLTRRSQNKDVKYQRESEGQPKGGASSKAYRFSFAILESPRQEKSLNEAESAHVQGEDRRCQPAIGRCQQSMLLQCTLSQRHPTTSPFAAELSRFHSFR